MQKITIYSDGACLGSPGDGGWGAILMCEKGTKEISGFQASTTNYRIELIGAIKALECLKEPCEVELYSDSGYLIDCFTKDWIGKWKSSEWIGSTGNKVKNIDLWKLLDQLNSTHKIKWIKVKAHSDNEYNNRCDQLATDEIKKHRESGGKAS
jgi:ribonuclease HI